MIVYAGDTAHLGSPREGVFFLVFALSGPLWRATSPIGGGKLVLL